MPSQAQKPPLSEAAGTFGQRVRECRHRLGLSQEALAERSELHWSYVGQVERGQNNLTLHNILRIAQVLQVDPAELVSGLQPPSSRAGSSESPGRRGRTRGELRKRRPDPG